MPSVVRLNHEDFNDRSAYYEALKELARIKRKLYQVDTSAFGLIEIRKIYKAEDIKIDLWSLPPKIKAMYVCTDGEYSVAVQEKLPYEPKLFAMVHELKHHYCDQEILASRPILCGDNNANEIIEKGAEVFAAEFIYPEAEFSQDIVPLRIARWEPRNVVEFKRGCKAKVSYKYLCKRLEGLHLISKGEFDSCKFKKLEEQIYGVPFYRRVKRL